MGFVSVFLTMETGHHEAPQIINADCVLYILLPPVGSTRIIELLLLSTSAVHGTAVVPLLIYTR